MKKLISSMLVFATVLGLSSLASAFQQEYTLDMGDQLIQAGPRVGKKTVFLKRELIRRYGLRGLDNDQLINVRVVSKTRAGRGSVALYSGQRLVEKEFVAAGDFNKDGPRTWDRVDLTPRRPGFSVGQAWQLDFEGFHKLRRIVVTVNHMRARPTPPPRPQPPQVGRGEIVQLGGTTVEKFFIERDAYSPKGNVVVSQIRIKGDRNFILVDNAYVVFKNGQRRELTELEGMLADGEVKIAQVANRGIQNIVIEAVSGLIGPRGKYTVSVRQHRMGAVQPNPGRPGPAPGRPGRPGRPFNGGHGR